MYLISPPRGASGTLIEPQMHKCLYIDPASRAVDGPTAQVNCLQFKDSRCSRLLAEAECRRRLFLWLASWTVADVDGNGASDLLTSTKHPDTGQNRIFIYANHGNGHFGMPVEWLVGSFPAGITKPWQLTPVDENGDGRIDLLIDQDGGTGWNFLRVLRLVAEPSPHFELITQERQTIGYGC